MTPVIFGVAFVAAIVFIFVATLIPPAKPKPKRAIDEFESALNKLIEERPKNG